MKKIININLSGRVIPIEDAAYEKLQAYIESLRKYFANEEGRDEIINDIESRIAELMNNKVRKGADAITDADVEEIINSMGRVEDFEAAEKESAANAASSTSSQQSSQTEYDYTQQKQSRGRLYRDSNDKFIGGVCSGIAAYMNVDPTIVRIIFAIVSFGGFGLGFLLYILLWIVLPTKDLDGYLGKRLYRNPDDRVIGGVAGGLAAYFNKSASMIRLIFAAPILLRILFGIINRISLDGDFDVAWNIGFGSLSGTFILIYIILWMILPEANTTYEKMEMRGEKVDVNRIRQNVKEGMGNMKERMKSWSHEVKESAQQFGSRAKEFSGTRGRAFASEAGETIRRTGGGLGHAIGVIFKAFFLFIFGTIAFALFVSLLALVFGGIAWWPVNNFLWTSKWQQAYAWGTLIFFLLVPLIGIIIWIIRRITRTRSHSGYLGWVFGGLWTIGWVAAILFVSSITHDFRYNRSVSVPVELKQPAGHKLIVTVSQPELEYSGNFGWIDDDGNSGWDLTNDTLKIAAVKFNVIASSDSLYHTSIRKYSFGRTEEDAIARASKVGYSIVSRDSLLDLGNCYALDKGSKFRAQIVEVEISVPIGKKIRFDKSVTDKLNSVNIKMKRGFRRSRISNFEIESGADRFHFNTNVDYTMGADGELKDPNGVTPAKQPVTTPGGNGYRYPGTKPAPAVTTDSVEDLDKSIEKTEKELRDLKEKKNQQKKTTGKSEPIKGNGNAEALSGGPSPVSAMSQWF